MNLPNKITLARMALVIVLIGLLFFPFTALGITIPNINVGLPGQGINLVYLIAGIIFLIASLSDFVDGYLARKWNQVTNFGKFMDPIADKLLVDSAFIFLISIPAWASEQVISVPTIVVILCIGRDLIVDAMRLVAAQRGQVIAANIFGKIKTVAEMVAIVFVFLNDWPFSYLGLPQGWSVTHILCYVAAIASLLSGVIYIVQNVHVLKDK